ncbi:MAG TPA: hypothetical protein VKD91_03260 [Pyrinomonadaceae bacterium]|nr:hypothetical protein [Pyrinomonadaceae bacterium]
MKANKIFATATNQTVSLVFLLVTSSGLTALAVPGPDFNGVWKLNQHEGDNTKEKIEQAIGKKKRLFGGMKQKRMSAALENVKAPETLQITQQGSQITITRPDGRPRTVYTDGRSQQIETRNGKTVEMNATQRPGQIVIETRTEGRRGKIIETYTLAANGRKLNVTLQVESERLSEPLVIHRVYDAAERE